MRVEVQAGDGALSIEAGNGTIQVRVGRPDAADAVIAGAPDAVLATLLGYGTLGEASKRGVRITGDARALARMIPGRGGRDERAGSREIRTPRTR